MMLRTKVDPKLPAKNAGVMSRDIANIVALGMHTDGVSPKEMADWYGFSLTRFQDNLRKLNKMYGYGYVVLESGSVRILPPKRRKPDFGKRVPNILEWAASH